MKISNSKRSKISEQILAYLYSISPKPAFTLYIAQEIARNEEFVKTLLLDLKEKQLILEIKKNPKGVPYLKRSRWRLTEKTFNLYKSKQTI
ncbi:MAG: hypothetical protein KKB31_02870 [Nanoarchaeota archaeon]|nr:hypothetical protein [Nanoarchaeota archaeon]